jgi:tRNA G37 N-methylase TrmD
MVMRVDVLARAIDAALADEPKDRPVIYLSPRGPRFRRSLTSWTARQTVFGKP